MFNQLKEENKNNPHWKTIVADDKDIEQIHKEIISEFDNYIEKEFDNNDLEQLKDTLFKDEN